MYIDALKIGAAAIALGLSAYAGSAGAVSMISMAEGKGQVVLVEDAAPCGVTWCARIRGEGVFCECDSLTGPCNPRESNESCSFVGSAQGGGEDYDEPLTGTCVFIGGKRYCK